MTVRGDGSRDWGRRVLGPARRRTIAAVTEAMFSDEGEGGLSPAPTALVDRVVDGYDLLVGAGSADLRRGFLVLTFLVEWLPFVVMGSFSRASRLPLSRRLTYLHRLEHAKLALLATLFVAFKLPLTMLAYEGDPELHQTGFDRATIATPRLVRRTERPSSDVDDIRPEGDAAALTSSGNPR